jgi:hypothetical protein
MGLLGVLFLFFFIELEFYFIFCLFFSHILKNIVLLRIYMLLDLGILVLHYYNYC